MSSESLFSDLEIGLHHWQPNRYTLDLRFTPPGSDSDERLVCDGERAVQFDWRALVTCQLDDLEYGRVLTETLLKDAEARSIFDRARQAADLKVVPLRLRLFINPNAAELHSVHWERLLDPSRNAPLLTGERVLFSRYLSSRTWGSSPLRRKGDLRCLIVIANPADLGKYNLAKVEIIDELRRAKIALDEIQVSELASGGTATLDNLVERLREGFDILYLVCHGSIVDGEPWLLLEKTTEAEERQNAAGCEPPEVVTHRVRGDDLVTRLAELPKRPQLVVLASCQSGGKGEAEWSSHDRGALAALGPKLAEAGIPAVVAMQGNIAMETVAAFMPRFFRELVQDGRIDRAMSLARGEVRDQPDWWVPALYMRLKSSRIWCTPGMSDVKGGLEKWEALCSSIANYRCTPILGPGLAEWVQGSRQNIARSWAKRYDFPMAPEDQEDLPRVAQFLAVKQQGFLAKTEWAKSVRETLRSRIQDYLSDLDITKPEDLELHNRIDSLAASEQGMTLDDFITLVAAPRQESDPYEPHRVLAELPILIYLTTDPSTLLEKALAKAGKDPQMAFYKWNAKADWPRSVLDNESGYRPSKERPLVYHLFGSLVKPESVLQPGDYFGSLVLTEDDYFEYLVGTTIGAITDKHKEEQFLPSFVRRALTDSSLLFLGFRLDEWDFRVLFRSIMQRAGYDKSKDYVHVAAQINPEESRILEPEGARSYLEKYFGRMDISIFWGNVDDFVQAQELKKCLLRGGRGQ